MIRPGEALDIILEKTPRLDAVRLPLVDALGCVLAKPVASDLDLPPFDKSAMDGYAVRSVDVAKTPVELTVVEELPAGVAPTKTVTPGTCAKIMTGAPVPEGADRVVMVEDTEPAGERCVRILRATPDRPNVCLRGEDVREGQQVIEAGRVLRPSETGLLASVGASEVSVYRRPRVACLATGDELVGIADLPGPGQIRDANSSILLAWCRRAGVAADALGVARDDETDLRAKITRGLERDVLLVSGGISMGEWDLVPKIFAEAGVTVHFATIAQKPGKPTIFATTGRGVVFGLPGNPVSTLVSFRLYVWPALRKMMGHAEPAPAAVRVTLAKSTTVRGTRLTYLPAKLDGETVEEIETKGSADLVGFSKANALLPLEPGSYDAGDIVDAIPLEI
ncbi:MAG TPA: gephyrin-like molybdotransferase Glp [Planctomycetota bacterium]|nr:gephyrin-like molybdotransferase Glp [Planctomycetota bacterium]